EARRLDDLLADEVARHLLHALELRGESVDARGRLRETIAELLVLDAKEDGSLGDLVSFLDIDRLDDAGDTGDDLSLPLDLESRRRAIEGRDRPDLRSLRGDRDGGPRGGRAKRAGDGLGGSASLAPGEEEREKREKRSQRRRGDRAGPRPERSGKLCAPSRVESIPRGQASGPVSSRFGGSTRSGASGARPE